MGADNLDIIKSVGRVFQVLELFDAKRMAMTSTDISRELNYPPSSTMTLLKSMVKMGYISFNPMEFTYIPTMRLLLTSEWVRDLIECDRDICTIMNDLSRDFEETITLCCENDGQMQVLRVLPGRHHPSRAKVGIHFPIFGSVIGQAALTRRSDYEIVQIAQKLNRRSGSRKQKIDIPDQLHRIREFRIMGHCMGHHPENPNLLILAWAIPSRLHDFPFVLSVGGLSERVNAAKDELIQRVRVVIRQRMSVHDTAAPWVDARSV
jgi:DNA-binding IclR family transcriptional regulator